MQHVQQQWMPRCIEKKWKLSVNSYINAAKSTCQGNKRENRSKESETKKAKTKSKHGKQKAEKLKNKTKQKANRSSNEKMLSGRHFNPATLLLPLSLLPLALPFPIPCSVLSTAALALAKICCKTPAIDL